MEACDIAYFKKYFFTDDKTSKGVYHFATILLPTIATGFENSVLCAVITSQDSSDKFTTLGLLKEEHSCFSKEKSFVCFRRRDLQSLNDLDNSQKQPIDRLTKEECRKGFKLLKNALFSDSKISPIERATIIREWKIKRDSFK